MSIPLMEVQFDKQSQRLIPSQEEAIVQAAVRARQRPSRMWW